MQSALPTVACRAASPPYLRPMSDEESKLTRTKRLWARTGRLLTGAAADPARDRLPPGKG